MAQQPTMKTWTDAWHNADTASFKQVYSKNAIIFPPNKPAIQGNENILAFMKGGLGKVDVVFHAESLLVSGNLAFETGTFKDVEWSGEKIIAEGQYTVTWILVNSVWKVHCHAWSMPVKIKS